jgi:sensor histidine kinase regulating citrate/malate metabolism
MDHDSATGPGLQQCIILLLGFKTLTWKSLEDVAGTSMSSYLSPFFLSTLLLSLTLSLSLSLSHVCMGIAPEHIAHLSSQRDL